MTMSKLSAAKATAAKPLDKDYKLADGGGLYLLVKKTGTKLWRQKYRFAGAEKLLSHGEFPVLPLAEARNLAIDAKRLIAQGIDPAKVKKDAKDALKIVPARKVTFKDVALEVFEEKKKHCSPKHAANYERSVDLHLMPSLGDRPIAEIGALELLDVCENVSKRGVYLAHRIAQRAAEIMEYSVLTERRDYNPLSSKAIHKKLKKCPDSVNFRAIKHDRLADFYHDLHESRAFPITKLLIEFVMHTFLRTGEVRRLEWSMVNFDKKLIDIPSGKEINKKNAPLVPLSDQVITILKKAHAIVGESGSPLVFPMYRDFFRKASENVITSAIENMGWKDEMTGHGLRATAATTLEEIGKFHKDHIDLQLGHIITKDKTQAAYRRVEFFKERVEIMNWWSDFLDQKKSESLILS